MLEKKFLKTKDVCDVTFTLNADAEEVLLVGDFNQWQPIEMKKAKRADAPFRAKVRMPQDGQFQFRYLVDQQEWRNDEAADAYWPNEHGTDNSVVFTANGS